MSIFYCQTCDNYRDSQGDDNANYDGEEIVCGACVEELEKQKQEWWFQQNQDNEWIETQLGA